MARVMIDGRQQETVGGDGECDDTKISTFLTIGTKEEGEDQQECATSVDKETGIELGNAGNKIEGVVISVPVLWKGFKVQDFKKLIGVSGLGRNQGNDASDSD